jgi:8-amino-7-oxononanoate synthase
VLCSNDYLGYATDRLIEVPRGVPLGAAASRLIAGDHPEHRALERELASWLGHEDALVFSSGYAANVGLLSSLLRPGDTVISDALNHASIIDGIRLARVPATVVPHNDVEAVERALAGAPSTGRRWVVTEGYFSMDGDQPDLRALRAICDRHGAALLVDDTHALGVFGDEGRGTCHLQGVTPDALVGTFGKALGGQGAFVAGSTLLTDWLWNRARSFVFSTGLSPLLAAANLAAVRRARLDDPGRARLAAIAARLRSALLDQGYRVLPSSVGPILPILVGPEEDALRLSDALLRRGVRALAIRPPTVPAGTSRLRVTVHARLSEEALERAIEAFRGARDGDDATTPASTTGSPPLASPRSLTSERLDRDPPASTTASPAFPARIVVVGTGTDVGKTFVSCALVSALRRRGAAAGAWKPVASGVDDTSPDSDALAGALGSPVAPPLYAFAPPISPHLAARQAGVAIAVEPLTARARELSAAHESFLIETAGGLFTPLSDEATNAELAAALGGALLLVAPDRLGVLHEVGATLRAAGVAGLVVKAVVLSAPEQPDASSGSNAAEIERVLGRTVAAVFPRASAEDPRVWACAEATLRALGSG